MTRFSSFARPPQALRASAVLGAADAAAWDAAAAVPLGWEELFASTGLFGIEIGPAADLADAMVHIEGFMTPPMVADMDYFVLSRDPLPNCPFCAPAASWPDDIVVVRTVAPGVDIDHGMRRIAVRGRLALGEAEGPLPGMVSHARLTGAIWRPV